MDINSLTQKSQEALQDEQRIATAAGRADLEADLDRRPRLSGPGAAPGQVSVTARLAKVLDAAAREAKRLKDEYVSVEHLVIAIAEEGKSTAAGRILASHGVTGDSFLR